VATTPVRQVHLALQARQEVPVVQVDPVVQADPAVQVARDLVVPMVQGLMGQEVITQVRSQY
jgi:hypothetical protein